MGGEEPLFARCVTAMGKGTEGLLLSTVFPGMAETRRGAIAFSNQASTKGVRISTECAMPAQSASRKS